jgi:hypothetical protein
VTVYLTRIGWGVDLMNLSQEITVMNFLFPKMLALLKWFGRYWLLKLGSSPINSMV